MIPSPAAKALAIALLGGVGLFFSLFVSFGPLFFKKRIGRGYSFFSDFPFELFDGAESTGKGLIRFFGGGFLLMDFCIGLFLVNAFSFYPHGVFVLALIAAFFHFTRVILLFFLFLLPARYNKPHVKVVTLYFVFAALSSILEGIFMIRYAAGRGGPLTMAFLLIALGLAHGFLMANPKFASWAKMNSEQDEQGEVIVKRPRFFLLAYSEWLAVLFDLLSTVFLDLGFLLLFLSE
ncbi:MAG: hypothetical protein J5736_04025 [Bacilli bacterium]|nr:hypothetical protein [Bacilli bacterium]